MINPRQYGWLPDIPDQRDYLYSAIKPKIRLPKKVDLIKNCSVVEDQERLGSCTACALAGNLEFLDIKDITGTVQATSGTASDDLKSILRRLPPAIMGLSRVTGTVPVDSYMGTLDRGLSRKTGTVPVNSYSRSLIRGLSPRLEYTDVSRLFIYYNERALRGNEDFDSGASLRDGIKTLRKLGFCWEKNWPYVIERFDQKPPKKCYMEAKNHLIESYYRIHTLSEMLICLAQGYPFVFGFTVYESFEAKKVSRTGIVHMPKKTERAIGGHAVLAVGYDQKGERFLVRNSWGTKWGQKGYFTIPFRYLETLAADFWTIRK